MGEKFLEFIKDENDLSEARMYTLSSIFENEIDEFYNSSFYAKETVSNGIVTAIKKFFINLIQEIERWVSSINIAVERKQREVGYRKNLISIEKKLKDAIDHGYEGKVTITDHDSILKNYKDKYKSLSAYGKKFAKMKYNSTAEIDKDIKEFNDLLTKYEKEMDFVENKTITVNVEEALKIVQKELSGNSSYLDSINDLKSDIRELEQEAILLEKRADELGSGVIPKHLNFIRLTAGNISKFSRKWIGRFVGKFVFTFANII
jgi:ribosomal protein L14E/L6E/L27E